MKFARVYARSSLNCKEIVNSYLLVLGDLLDNNLVGWVTNEIAYA